MNQLLPIDLSRLRSTGRNLPQILQSEGAECGLACIAMIACYHGHDVDMTSLRRRFSTSLKGVNLVRIIDMGAKLGFTARPLRVELQGLSQLKLPCILHWNMNHFVVLRRVGKRGVVIHDPSRGVRSLSFDELSGSYTGVVLELTPNATFVPVKERASISIRALTGHVVGLKRSLGNIAALAIALEIMVLAGPFYLQWVVDQTLVAADGELLTLLGIAFLALVFFQGAFSAVRSWAVVWLGSTLNLQWFNNVFGHLLHLPLDWFQKRHVGDILSRFDSMQTIQRTLTTQFVEGVLDGLMSVTTLVILSIYSVELTLMVLAAFGFYVAIRWAIFGQLRRVGEEQLVYAAKLQSDLMESVRGAQPIKLHGKQNERRSRFANTLVSSTNRDIDIQRLGIVFNTSRQWIVNALRVLVIWVAAKEVLAGRFSTGMMIAFIAYADQFSTRMAQLVDKLADIRMLRLHAERLSDIALASPETDLEPSYLGPIPELSIELDHVSFRYAEGEPWVVKDCNFKVKAGEALALVGPSGSGKTTIAKLILGLLQPNEGRILVGGLDVRSVGLDRYRSLIGTVMQDDQLFAGSFAENIAFFDADSDQGRIEEAAALAAIHDDIISMPMGYGTMVGDMGSALSGGQKQRLLLARALYRKPRILVLDEATSHLDIEREHQVNAAIANMNITRIIIAHRPETIASADRAMNIAA